MARGDHQMRVRLPEELKDQLEAEAKTAGRSMNAEIVFRLMRDIGLEEDKTHTSRALLNLRSAVSDMNLALRQYKLLISDLVPAEKDRMVELAGQVLEAQRLAESAKRPDLAMGFKPQIDRVLGSITQLPPATPKSVKGGRKT